MDLIETKNNVEALAGRLEKDIRQKGLVPGQRYLIARDASVLFDENIITVHRAMKMLADRKVLVRQRRKGTFIGPDIEKSFSSSVFDISCVHIIVSASYYQTSGMPDNDIIEGVKQILPEIPVQLHYLPANCSLEYVKNIIRQINLSQDRQALLLIHSSREMQELVVSSGVLAAVFGCVYPGIKGLAWVDVDQEQSGQLMASFVLSRGHKKFALLMRSQWLRGDNLLHSGITSCLGAAGLSMGALVTLSLPSDIAIIKDELRSLLQGNDAPTAILCRSDYYADIAVDVAKELGLQLGSDIEIVSGGHMRASQVQQYPCITPKMGNQQQIATIVEKLSRQAKGQSINDDYLLVPAMLCEGN